MSLTNTSNIPPPPPAPTFVYRILARDEWRAAIAEGKYSGSSLDHRDGFIHLSTLEQSINTAKLYFPQHKSLLMAKIKVKNLSDFLSWDYNEIRQSHFPHYHQKSIDCKLINEMIELSENDDNSFTLPPHLQSNIKDPWLYKIASVKDWNNAKLSGNYLGNEKDLVDGFIHFSAADQVAWVVKKFLSSSDQLCLITLKSSILTGAQLVWEFAPKMRNQESTLGFIPIFAHCYDKINGIPVKSVHSVQSLTIDNLKNIETFIQQ